MVKFQHLILPFILWLAVSASIILLVPTSPIIIGFVLILISQAIYFSLRIVTHSKTPIIVTCCVSLFLLSNVFSGFNIINLLLIAAIGTLIVVLTK